MFKSMFTLIRGRAAEAEEAFVDTNAIAILRQQMREASVAIKRSRSAVGVAVAGHEREIARHSKIKSQLQDLETRTVAALEAGKDEMAQEAAEAIAVLEDEAISSQKAQARFNTEINRLKSDIRAAQIKLRDLQRGERLASATSQTQKLQGVAPSANSSSLRDAEETLRRLETKQQGIDIARNAELELEQSTAPGDIAERMAAEGIGKPMKSSADAVLERLKAKQSKSKK